jgi:amino acid adenylation domain-containing protein
MIDRSILHAMPVEEKQELVKHLLGLRQGAEDSLPLSHGQASLWFLHELAPTSPAYNFLYAARIAGEVDGTILRRACRLLLSRHPALRTRFLLRDHKPLQQIEPDVSLDIAVTDASTWSEERLIDEMRRRADLPFDLGQAPCLRVELFRRSPSAFVLLLTFHHIVADLWSADLLVQELRQTYADLHAGRPISLPPVSARFADFVRWETVQIYNERGRKARDYWHNLLAGELPVLQLPTDRPRPPMQTYNGTAHSWTLKPEVVRKLRALTDEQGVTRFVALLAVFQLFLQRLTGQKDILVGTPVAGRERAEWERVVGYFLNQVVVRTSFASERSFRQLLEETREQVLRAMEHSTYPFGLLVKQLQAKRDPARPPIFQAMFVWDKPRDAGNAAEEGLPVEPLLMEQRGAPFDLTLILFELGEKLVASFRYNSELFEAATIQRWAGHFDTLLESLVHSADVPLAEVESLSPAEKQQILVEWNRTEAPYPACCFHELFERQVRQSPAAIALSFEKTTLSYDEVNRRANRLARHLRLLGVRPGDTVAISLPRGPNLIVSVLAAWKAGAAYLFLDPLDPGKRQDVVITDARPAAVITDNSGIEWPSKVVRLDADEARIRSLDDANLDLPLSLENRAYLIYTSGSTGEPKGVVLRHRGLVNLWAAQQQAFAAGSQDRVLQFASFSFDASVFELAMAVASGATLVLGSQTALLPGRPLWEMLRDEAISNVTLPPSVLAMLPADPLPSLRTLIVAGEACSAELVNTWAPGRRFFNAYGPTETTVWATVAECVPGERPPTIGRPIANARVYVLDDELRPVPVGVAGELYVAGPGVALGYLNRPELTAECFLPNPFDQADEAILYRTGDVVRWAATGELEFVGRADQQVKIRGHRIELEEIQEVLRGHPDVQDAAVIVRKDAAETPSLAAYVVPRKGIHFSVPAVRAHLRERLPRYMLPTAVVPLDAFPLGTTGKLDRARLPDPTTASTAPKTNGIAPSSPHIEAGDTLALRSAGVSPAIAELEQRLARIWERVLKVERVGTHDHFFELGGASTQTLEVAALAREQGLSLSPEMLFRHQTIAELAAALDRAKGNGIPVAPAPTALPSAVTSREPAANGRSRLEGPGALLESIGVYLPEKSLSTEEILSECRTRIEFPLERLTGIRSRRVAGDTEFSIDLAEKAADECLRRAACAPGEIDLLICCNISRYDGPYRCSLEPATAARIARRFGLVNAVAFDLTNACAGTFTAVLLADALLRQGTIRRAMIVSGEYITHLTRTAQREIEGFMDPRLPCLTLGDSGVALLLGRAPRAEVGFQDLELYTLGKYHNLCVAKLSTVPGSGPIMHTDSVTSTVVTIKQAVGHAAEVLRRKRWDPQTVKGLVIHQTSETTLDGAVQEINRALGKPVCDRGNTLYNVAERGNTATNTHFLAVYEAIQAGRFATGDRLVFAVSGSGQTVGTALYTFDDLPERLRLPAPERDRKAAGPAEPVRHFRLPRRVRIESIATVDKPTDAPADTVALIRQVGEDCLKRSARPREEIDLVLHTGVYRSEFLAEPSVASIAAGELAINHDDKQEGSRRTLAFDILNGAGGTLTACFAAAQMMTARQFSRALLLASEVEPCREFGPENHIPRKEGASALVLEESGGGEGFAAFGFRSFSGHQGVLTSETGVHENGPAIFHHRDAHLETIGVECIRQAVREFLARESISPADLGLVVPPQRPGALGSHIAEALGVPAEKVVSLGAERDYYTSSLACSLEKLRQKGRISAGAPILFIEVTAGLQVWCALYYV